jgi:hypothetical protein
MKNHSILLIVALGAFAFLAGPDLAPYWKYCEAVTSGATDQPSVLTSKSKSKSNSNYTTATTNTPIPIYPRNGGGASEKEEGWVVELRTPYLVNASWLYQSGHFEKVGNSMARAYGDKSQEMICSFVPLTQKKSWRTKFFAGIPKGLFLNKVPKTASTVLTAVNIRIARRLGARINIALEKEEGASSSLSSSSKKQHNNNNVCAHYDTHCHGNAPSFFGDRSPTRSFLWGSLRDPASRAMSRIFFERFSKHNKDAKLARDEVILRDLKEDHDRHYGTVSAGQGGFQTQYLALEDMEEWSTWSKSYPTLVQRPDLLEERVQKIVNDYDFLALTERLEESLVVLQLLLGLPLGDILSMSSKVSGESYYFHQTRPKDPGTCVPIQKPFRTPAIEAYVTSDEWYAANYADYVLYAAANTSLDMTIERLGKDRLDRSLQQFRHAQNLVAERCRDEIFPPCSPNGKVQTKKSERNCYQKDQGCGYRCIDKVALEQGW